MGVNVFYNKALVAFVWLMVEGFMVAAPVVHLSLVAFSEHSPSERQLLLSTLQEKLDQASQLSWEQGLGSWTQLGEGDEYYYIFAARNPDEVLVFATRLAHLVSRFNRESPELPLRINLALVLGDSSGKGHLVERKALDESTGMLGSAVFSQYEQALWDWNHSTGALGVSDVYLEACRVGNSPRTTGLAWLNIKDTRRAFKILDQEIPGYCPVNKPNKPVVRTVSKEVQFNPDRPIVITQLRLKHFRSALNVHVDLEKELNIFAGVNGSGKTTLLDAVAMLLSTFSSKIHEVPSVRRPSELDITRGEVELTIGLSCEHDGQIFDWDVSSDPDLPTAKGSGSLDLFAKEMRRQFKAWNVNLPVLAYYPINRVVVEIPAVLDEQLGLGPLSVYEEPFAGIFDFKSFTKWFRRREDLENENFKYRNAPINSEHYQYPDHQLEAVRHALSYVMPEFSNLAVQRQPEPLLMVEKKAALFRVDQLSGGEKCLMALVADLARRLAMTNPNRLNPLEGFGVVLIDELDLHLHPQWQHKVIPLLRQTFPNCQFLISTHSPHVLTHVAKEDLFLLSLGREGLAVSKPRESYGKNAERILEDLMGLATTRADDVQADLHRLAMLIDANKFDEARAFIDQMRGQIGEDPELVKAGVLIRRKELIGK